MPDAIIDGTGTGYQVKVNAHNRLTVDSIADSVQHDISITHGQAYQVIGHATLAAGTVVGLYVRNSSRTRNLVITYIRHQIVDNAGGTSFPNGSNYFRMALGRTHDSGGTVATPVNLNQASGNDAEVTAYQGNPTLTGTAYEIDRQYTKAAGDMNTFNKEGSVILQPNTTFEMAYIGDQTSGTLYTRLSFLMKEVVIS